MLHGAKTTKEDAYSFLPTTLFVTQYRALHMKAYLYNHLHSP